MVVSEETGSISLVVRGRIERNLTEEQLRRRIFNLIRPQAPRRAVPFLRRSNEGRWQLGERRSRRGSRGRSIPTRASSRGRRPDREALTMGILLRNWHLKLSAVLLSTVLYTGLVFSGSFTDVDDPGPRSSR